MPTIPPGTRTPIDDDGDGTIDRIEFDFDEDGTIDRTVHLNADGRWERVERDVDDDGNIDRIDHYTFDDDGTSRVTRRDFDLDDDGTLDRTAHLNADGRWERVERDLDDDGNIDRITHYTFDDDGTSRVTRRDFDLDDDGTLDRTAHLNADGRWERVERDVDEDGNIDRITHYTFDDDGTSRVTRRDFDLDDDGTLDRTAHLNADGRWERVERDLDDDGNIDRIDHYTFDDDGTSRVTRRDFDLDDDGTTDRREDYNYNSDGDRTRIDIDLDVDGTIDRTIHLNADGRWERVERDVDDDGTIDRTVHRNTDGSGTLNRIDFDDDGDGTTDRSQLYTQNTDNNRIRTDFDDDANGTIDRNETYTYDANDRVSQTSFDDDNDSTTDRIETYTYDDDGNRTRTDFDDDADSTTDRNEAYMYDSDGNLIRTDFDDDNDGDTDRSEAYTYDSDGNLIQTDFDDDGDGNIDRIERELSSLDGTNGFILTGIDANDRSGVSVSSAGDVNGDGYDDLVIGARGAAPGGDSNAGETYVVYGGASAPGTGGVLDLSALDGTNGFILTGIDANDQSGRSVSSAGDVNGDGYDDLVIGANRADPNGDSEAGETYVIYGGANAPGTGGVLDLGALDGTNGFTLTGIDANDRSGRSVSSAGDVNGDGYDDLIIGAYFADPNGDSAGETYVIYGGANAPGTDSVLDLSALDGTNGFILTGINEGDQSGRSVASAGDVNGDGYDDLVIGAWRADPNGDSEAGETYVVYGGASAPGTGGVLDLSDLDGSNGFILNGIDAYDRSGFSVSSAGDVNGDGYDDLIIGANIAGVFLAGETYVVYGGANAPGTGGVLDLSALDGTNGFILNGINPFGQSGWSVSSAGDVNGDGYDDLVIGAPFAYANGLTSGQTYVIYGGANAPGINGELDLSDLDGTNGFILNGIDAGDESGFSVSAAGDVNGDGYDDLVIGAREATPGGDFQAGETYVLYGGATGTESLVPVTASGTAAADNFTGNAGADSFTGIAMNDVVRGGAGNDRIRVTALDFAAIDGGTGVDTLVLDGAGLALDLTGPGHAGVDSVEVFDLSGTGANTLVLDALAVFDVTEERAGGVASLDVLGDADDRVDLSGSSFALTGTATEDGVTYNVYRDGNAQVRVEDGVSVTLAAAGSQSARSLTAGPDRILPDLSHADAREGIDGTGLHSLGHSPGMDVDFVDGFSESEFEWTGVVVTGLAPPDMQAPAPGPLSSGQAINLFDVLTGYDLSYDLLL